MRILRVSSMAMLALLAACSSQQMYTSGQYLQRNQCMQLVEQAAMDKCLQQAELPYEQYTHARGESLP
ncbi:hypothetical protein [Methylophilus aquaticus]|uniref:Lipoprotein n=1 Tax=Methylophilus aquaticus TaxID=1971610 RepID=A0ABT9JVH6_9PROT|nr:hypothetical protein [Methylophilus aquaticus]MDP8568464.1 hypothetical protein [Methylophilus aquaticus]